KPASAAAAPALPAPRPATAARRSPATRREPASRRDPRENAPLIHKRGGRDRSGPLPVPAARRLRLALRLAALERDELAGVAIAGPHQVPVLPRVGVEDRERAEAAPLLAGLDDGDGHAVEASPLHARVEVARVADRPPHDVRAQKPSCPGLRPGPSSASRQA